MKIDLLLYPQFGTAPNFNDKKVVVLDVLRATSTIITALANRATEVIPVGEPMEAVELVKSIGVEECITGGERKGIKIEGLVLGNSPFEYTETRVAGKKVILTTSNGTKAIKWVQQAAEVAIGSFLNLRAAVNFLKEAPQDSIILCSGSDTGLSLEDLACAGLIIQRLWKEGSEFELTDSAKVAVYVAEKAALAGLSQFVGETDHGRYLQGLGLGEDIAECVTLDKYLILPKFKNGKISLEK